MSYEEAVMDETTVENLAALMAMLQLTIFAELYVSRPLLNSTFYLRGASANSKIICRVPKRSRSLLRAGLAHYKDLQDSASSEQEKLEIKKAFALGLYVSICIIVLILSLLEALLTPVFYSLPTL